MAKRKTSKPEPPEASRPDLLDILASGSPPAFATDAEDRIVFWNKGAEDLLGQSAAQTLGKHCFSVVAGRDVFGNRFCHRECSVLSATREGEVVRGYEFSVIPLAVPPPSALPPGAVEQKNLAVTIFQIFGSRPETFTIVHVLQAVDNGSRLASLLRQIDLPKGVDPLVPLGALPSVPPSDNPPLTEREREILHWVAAGLQNKEIAQKLDISLATVRNHIHRILEKLEVHSKLEAVSLAFRRGWVAGEGGQVLEN